MLGNFNPKAIQDLKNLRAESQQSSILSFAKIHFKKTPFTTFEELNDFLKQLPDDEFEHYIDLLVASDFGRTPRA